MAVDFNTILPHELIAIGGTVLFVWVLGGVLFNLYRWRRIIASYRSESSRAGHPRSILRAFNKTFRRDVLVQRDLLACDLSKWLSHISTFWGFNLLAVATTLNYLLNPSALPLAITHPVRIVGNLGGVLFMGGLTLMIYRRASSKSIRGSTRSGDVIFLVLLYVVGLTGFMTEAFSDANLFLPTFGSYWAHMVSIAALFALAPFTKFVHALGRPLLSLLDGYGEARGLEGNKNDKTLDPTLPKLPSTRRPPRNQNRSRQH